MARASEGTSLPLHKGGESVPEVLAQDILALATPGYYKTFKTETSIHNGEGGLDWPKERSRSEKREGKKVLA